MSAPPADHEMTMPVKHIFGVDFSGAAKAGENIWIAIAAPSRTRLRLTGLHRLEDLAGAADRVTSLAHLVKLIEQSSNAVWGIDFPFGLPVELAAMGATWRDQLTFVQTYRGDAKAFGRWCVDEAKKIGPKLHIRRCSDTETKTPFDCYHYRIIYQTFHGMRDVLSPLAASRNIAVLPFHYARFRNVTTVVVEACPSSTLKRLSLPHQNYKQPAGGPLLAKRKKTRRAILAALDRLIEVSAEHRRTIMRNPGGDALDAVIAAVGSWQAFTSADHAAIAKHARYRREGRVYA